MNHYIPGTEIVNVKEVNCDINTDSIGSLYKLRMHLQVIHNIGVGVSPSAFGMKKVRQF